MLWLSVVTSNDAKPSPKAVSSIWREFNVTRIRTRLGEFWPHLKPFTRENLAPTEKVPRSGHPSYHVNVTKIKWGIVIMERRVTPPKQVTSPTWCPTSMSTGPKKRMNKGITYVWSYFHTQNPTPITSLKNEFSVSCHYQQLKIITVLVKYIIFVKTGRNYHLMSTAMVPLVLHQLYATFYPTFSVCSCADSGR